MAVENRWRYVDLNAFHWGTYNLNNNNNNNASPFSDPCLQTHLKYDDPGHVPGEHHRD